MNALTLLFLLVKISGHVSASQAEIIRGNGSRTFLLIQPVINLTDVEIHADSGFYFDDRKKAVLWRNLILTGPYYHIVSDTMVYVESPESLMFSGNAVLEDTAYILRADKVVKAADSAFAWGNLRIRDKKRNMDFSGDSGVYIIPTRRGILIGNASAVSTADSSPVTVRAERIVFMQDTFRAYGNVLSTGNGYESSSDSACFILNDSTAILWSRVTINWEDGTASGDSAVVYFSGGKIRELELHGNASFQVADSTGRLSLRGTQIQLLHPRNTDEFELTATGNCTGNYVSLADSDSTSRGGG